MAIYSIEYIDIYAYNRTWYNNAMLQYGWNIGWNVGRRKGGGKFGLKGKGGRFLLGYVLTGGNLLKELCWNVDPRSSNGINLSEKSHLLPLRQWPFLFKKEQNTLALLSKFLLLSGDFL